MAFQALSFFGKPQGALRGWAWPDIAHRRHNNFLDAVEENSLCWLRHEMSFNATIFSAPWSGCGNFSKLSDAAAECFANSDASGELFALSYPLMVFDVCGGVIPPDFNTREHMQTIWDMFGEAKVWASKIENVAPGRWFQSTRRYRGVYRYNGFLIHFVTWMGLFLNWWPELESTPLYRALKGRPVPDPVGGGGDRQEGGEDDGDDGAADGEQGQSPQGGGAPGGDPTTTQGSRREVEKCWQECSFRACQSDKQACDALSEHLLVCLDPAGGDPPAPGVFPRWRLLPNA